MRIRLYRGPFNGKVMDWSGGRLVIAGPKKMTRRQRYEWYRDNAQMISYGKPESHLPIVEAEYEMAYRNGQPCYHPDGSVFYEWNGRKRER